MRQLLIIYILFAPFGSLCAQSHKLNKQQIQNVKRIIQLFQNDQVDSLVAHTTYPLLREYPIPTIKDAAQMKARFDGVFDKWLRKAIARSSPDEWKPVGWRGIMFRNGLVWLGAYGENIIAVNAQSRYEQNMKKQLIKEDKQNLYPTLRDFKKPIIRVKTEHYLIRIDKLKDGTYRYASWEAGEKESSKPDLILTNGTVKFEGSGGNHHYTFVHGNYTYIVYRWIIGPVGGSDAMLDVKKDGKVMLREDGSLLEINSGELRFPREIN